MRLTGAIVISLFAAQCAVANDSEFLDWSAARRLSWDDFTAGVPSGTEGNRVAETSASIAWSYEYRLEWSRDRCVYRIVAINTWARFNPDSSWVRPGHQTDAVLAHEQGHFDITELYRERFAAQTSELLDADRSCRGRTNRAVTQSAEREITQTLGMAYEEIWQQYRVEQERYDADTQHGIDADAQAEWLKRISESLNAPILN